MSLAERRIPDGLVPRIISPAFGAMVFILAFYSLGFFTNLVQIRGVDKELYDRFQAYVRLLFDFSLAAIVVLAVLRMSGFRLWNSFGRFQFALAALLALCMIVLSLYSLWRMPSFREAYLQVNVEDVRIYYPDYEATTTVFSFGFVIFIMNLLISGQFLAMLTARAIAGLKGADS